MEKDIEQNLDKLNKRNETFNDHYSVYPIDVSNNESYQIVSNNKNHCQENKSFGKIECFSFTNEYTIEMSTIDFIYGVTLWDIDGEEKSMAEDIPTDIHQEYRDLKLGITYLEKKVVVYKNIIVNNGLQNELDKVEENLI